MKLYADQRGFSMVEVITVLVISALTMATAVPAWFDMIRSIDRADAIHQIETELRRAKSEALSAGVRAVVLTAANGKTLNIGLDLVPYNSPASSDQSVVNASFPDTISVTGSKKMIFDARGFLVDETGEPTTTTFDVYSNGTQYATVTVNPAGFIQFVES